MDEYEMEEWYGNEKEVHSAYQWHSRRLCHIGLDIEGEVSVMGKRWKGGVE